MEHKLTSTIYADAYKYSQVLGYSVIPVGKDKKPLLKSWKEFQTRIATEDEIKGWWTKWPSANVGIVTGEISGITVIDVDTHKGASAQPFPDTYTVKTGNGGLQLYYKYHPGLSVSANAYPQFPHIDIRSDGGFVVAPPSVITPTVKGQNGVYEVVNGGEFAEFPGKLFGEKRKKKFTEKFTVGVGERNDSIVSVIGTILRNLAEKDFATDGWESVKKINETYKPPISEKELRTKFEAIVQKELNRRDSLGKPTPSPIQISTDERINILLRKNGNGVPYKDMTNAVLVLEQHPETKDSIKFNEFRQDIEYKGRPFEERDLLDLVHLMQSGAGLPNISKDTVLSAVQHYAHKNKYDEAVDWLESLVWDSTPRLEKWLITATGVEDDEYHRTVGMNWLCGMVRRMSQPGCIFDHVLVAVGDQGIGKTSLFRIIGGPWYKSYTGAVDNKDFYLTLRGAALLDLDEGVAMYKSESIKIKSIITQQVDEYRAPYDRTTKKIPRRFVFSMSTNDSEPFRDVTGNRRYWPIDIKEKVNFAWLEENREQLFAEAYYIVKSNVEIPFVPFELAMERQKDHLPEDEWTDSIKAYLRKSYKYCTGDEEYSVSLLEIYQEALKAERIEMFGRKQSLRISNILKSDCGMEKRRVRGGNDRQYRYFLTPKFAKQLQERPYVAEPDEFDTL